jgi:hypothetical protein
MLNLPKSEIHAKQLTRGSPQLHPGNCPNPCWFYAEKGFFFKENADVITKY